MIGSAPKLPKCPPGRTRRAIAPKRAASPPKPIAGPSSMVLSLVLSVRSVSHPGQTAQHRVGYQRLRQDGAAAWRST
jgi:hypothetical protein